MSNVSSNDYKQLAMEKATTTEVLNQAPPPAYTPQAHPTVVTVPPTTAKAIAVVNGETHIKDYLILSLITTLCCCMPLGLIALIKSFEVRGALQRGDLTTAQSASDTARTFNKIGIILGILIFVLTFFVVLVSQLSWIIPLALGSYDKKDY